MPSLEVPEGFEVSKEKEGELTAVGPGLCQAPRSLYTITTDLTHLALSYRVYFNKSAEVIGIGVTMEKVYLFCFPHGGSGASIYKSWTRLVPDWLLISPVQFPGREEKSNEPLPTDVSSLVGTLLPDFIGVQTCAFFGHSLGALVAFQLARSLRRLGNKIPDVLLVSGYPAPHLPRLRPRISHLPRQEFTEALEANFDISEALRLDSTLLDYAYPTLAADFSLVENYRYREESPLDIPISVFGGDHDLEASEEQLRAWQNHSTHPIRLHILSGDHFYLHSATDELLGRIIADLKELVTRQR